MVQLGPRTDFYSWFQTIVRAVVIALRLFFNMAIVRHISFTYWKLRWSKVAAQCSISCQSIDCGFFATISESRCRCYDETP